MPLSAGTRLGPYEIISPLGAGGMGEVYKAHDPRLRRDVAIKVLPAEMARHPDRLARFQREARAVAALNHPHIVTLHSVEEAAGVHFLTMELVEGQSLDGVIAGGRLPVERITAIAMAVAEALAVAHDKGIVHRDLKPANIMVTGDDRVKVLDFGLAKELRDADPDEATLASVSHTNVGVVMGTPAYMSPEQVAGRAINHSTDIFSLGIVMYEMASGRRPFTGASAAELASAILRDTPGPISDIRDDLPDDLARIIRRCLEKDPRHRVQTARDIANELRDLARHESQTGAVLAPITRELSSTPATRPQIAERSHGRRWSALTALLGAALVTGLLLFLYSSRAGRVGVPDARPPVVAVVPLTNASGDAGKDYLALGVADNLITRLASLRSITVLSRSAVADARARTRELPALAAQLDATYVVDGSVQQAGDEIRINLSLVRPDGSIAWADTVEGRFDGILALQTRLASALAQAVVVQLSVADRAALEQQATTSTEALASYWRGKALLERRDIKGNLEAALASYDEALTIDPRFADAYAARGEALWVRYSDARRPEDAQAAIDANTAALRLDPNRAEVRNALSIILAGTGQLDAATEEVHRALALRPNFEDARIQLGRVLARQGRTDEAINEFKKVSEQRPNSVAPYSATGASLYEAGRYQEAAAAFERVTVLQPDNVIAYQQVGVAYQAMGDNDRALAFYQKALAIRPYPQAYSNIGAIYHERGEYAKAVDAYQQAIALRPNARETHRNLGDALGRMGRQTEAIAAYRRAIQLAESDLKVNPHDARIVASLAVYLQKAGDTGNAAARATEAVAWHPKTSTCFAARRKFTRLPAGRRRPWTRSRPQWQMDYDPRRPLQKMSSGLFASPRAFRPSCGRSGSSDGVTTTSPSDTPGSRTDSRPAHW